MVAALVTMALFHTYRPPPFFPLIFFLFHGTEQSVVVPLQPYMDEQYLEGLPPGVAGNNEGATSLSHMMHKVSADESLNLDHTENRLRASAVAARKALEDATPGVRNGVAFKYNVRAHAPCPRQRCGEFA